MRTKKHWALDEEAFDLLLLSLDADRHKAGERYESLRRRIVRFFEWRGTASPDDCADEVLNTLARRMSEGEVIRNVASYSAGVARMVLLEKRSIGRKEMPLTRELLCHTAGQPSTEEGETRLAVLEQCLEALPSEDRDLLFDYYNGEGRERIDERKKLAERLRLPPNALRIRVHRIREQVEYRMRQILRAGK